MTCGHLGALLTLSVLVAGCAATPKAQLAYIDDPAQLTGAEIDSYAFPRTIVDISAAADTKVSVITRNAPYEKFRIAVRKKDGPGVRTNLNLTKVANSDMLEEAGVQVFDDRVKFIGEIGKIATSLIGLGIRPFAAGPTLPLSLETEPLLRGMPREGAGDVADPAKWKAVNGVTYWIGPVQPDARVVSGAAIAALDGGIAYAACREMKLDFDISTTTGEGAGLTTTSSKIARGIYVADPHYFRFVAFPQKGKIKIHSQCGVSVSSEKDDTIASDAAILGAVLTQVQEVKKAADEADKKAEEAKKKAEEAAKKPAGV